MKPRWTKLATLGLLMVAAGPGLFLIAFLAYRLDLGDAPIFMIATVVPLIGSILVWRFGTWAKIVGILAALVPAGATFWTVFSITQIDSFFDFVPAILVIPGAFIVILSCIASMVAGRREHTGTSATGGERAAIRVVLGLVLLLSAASAALTFTGGEDVSEADATLVVTMKTFEFDPKDLDLQQGDSILIRNDDPFFHTFTVDSLAIDESFTASAEVLVRIPDDPGTYIFYCTPHTFNKDDPAEDDMAGTLTIE